MVVCSVEMKRRIKKKKLNGIYLFSAKMMKEYLKGAKTSNQEEVTIVIVYSSNNISLIYPIK
ncbi:hypothetical protein SESBI_46979 [Sesbania bispinosa]|nr:hypothetical protein SESBI_46979 [Sesbania bispinosa]